MQNRDQRNSSVSEYEIAKTASIIESIKYQPTDNSSIEILSNQNAILIKSDESLSDIFQNLDNTINNYVKKKNKLKSNDDKHNAILSYLL